MWMEEYDKLSEWEKEEFTKIANMLLSKTFVLRYKLNVKERLSKLNYEYTFIERHMLLFKEYLKLSGWNINVKTNYGVISIYNKYDYNRVKLSKDVTHILFILRLIYEEEREKLTLSQNIMTSVYDIIEKIKNVGLRDKKLADKILMDSFSFLKNHNIIDKVEGDWDEPGTMIIIYPSILFVVPDDKLIEIHDSISSIEITDNEETEDLEETL